MGGGFLFELAPADIEDPHPREEQELRADDRDRAAMQPEAYDQGDGEACKAEEAALLLLHFTDAVEEHGKDDAERESEQNWEVIVRVVQRCLGLRGLDWRGRERSTDEFRKERRRTASVVK
jgi:hypothetical protein